MTAESHFLMQDWGEVLYRSGVVSDHFKLVGGDVLGFISFLHTSTHLPGPTLQKTPDATT
jgi:hypothetical protein